MIKLKNIITEQTHYKIYCDMDSVLTDFDRAFGKLTGFETKTGWEYRDKHGEERVWGIITKAGLPFWTEMPWMPEGKKIWNYIRDFNPIILSAPATEDIENCKTGKLIWCKRNLGPHTQIIVEKDKYKYADKNSILIDDREKNTVPWEQHGGIAILYISADDTIEKLKRLGL